MRPCPTLLRVVVFATLSISLLTPGAIDAQTQKTQSDDTLDSSTRLEVIGTTLRLISQNYVFPDIARQIENAFRDRLKKKEYDSITSPAILAEVLTSQLQQISHDKHMSVFYSREPLPPPGESTESPKEKDNRRHLAALSNFGFNRVERLSGNVGYMDLNIFWWLDVGGGDTAVAAMDFLADTSALMIDLRNNRGGDPAMVALLATYFFDKEPVELTGIYWRPSDNTNRSWTLPYVPGKRYLNKDVYILTSKNTFSAAEAFTYDLQNLKRATIVGETTGGGANPREGYPVNKNQHFIVFVPTGRAISPLTKTNWEGIGVKPDIEVAAEFALKTAHLVALKKLLEKNAEAALTDELKSSIETLQRELQALSKKN
ncbi:MAG: S41 family peptidase [Pyrinomonadaceae bacterium]